MFFLSISSRTFRRSRTFHWVFVFLNNIWAYFLSIPVSVTISFVWETEKVWRETKSIKYTFFPLFLLSIHLFLFPPLTWLTQFHFSLLFYFRTFILISLSLSFISFTLLNGGKKVEFRGKKWEWYKKFWKAHFKEREKEIGNVVSKNVLKLIFFHFRLTTSYTLSHLTLFLQFYFLLLFIQ